MPTKLIEMEGLLIEAEAKSGEAEQIAKSAAEQVKGSLGKIKPIIVAVCKPGSARLGRT